MEIRTGKFKTKDGIELHFEHWSPPKVKGNIVFVHGLGDHSGRYRHFVQYFTAKGFRVCLYDQRGHGLSEGKRVFATRFDIFCDDLLQYVERSRCDGFLRRPWFLLGHSFGGQVVLNFLAQHSNLFQAACVSSPNIRLALTMPKWQEKFGRMVLPIWPGMKLKGIAKPHWISHDTQVVEAYKKDPLVSCYVTLGLGKEVLTNSEKIFSLCSRIKTPLLMLHGSEDHYCYMEGTRDFFYQLKLAKKALKIYEGMYHELLNETIRETVFEEICRWFEECAS